MGWVHAVSFAINRGVETVVGVLAMAMAAVTGLQVVFRYGLNHSLFWSEEVGRILLVWITFLGATIAFRRKAHVGIDVAVRRLTPRAQRCVERVLLGLSSIFFLVLVGYGLRFIRFIAYQKTAALGLPMGLPYAVIPLSGLIFLIHAVSLALEHGGEASREPSRTP